MRTPSTDIVVVAEDLIKELAALFGASSRFVWTNNSRAVVHQAKRGHHGVWRDGRQRELGRTIAGAIPRTRGDFAVAINAEIPAS